MGIGLALAGCEYNHVIERIWFHSCEYSRNYHILRDVAGDATTRRVAGVIVDLLRYDNFVVCYTESYPQRIT